MSSYLARLKPIYRSALLLAFLIVIINLLLLVYGYAASGPERVFGGLIYNTIDGQSYLVKMKEGLMGIGALPWHTPAKRARARLFFSTTSSSAT